MPENGDARRAGVKEGKKLTQYLGALAACLFAVCGGTTLGWTSAASSLQAGGDFPVTESDWSWVGALHPTGAVLSALPVGSLVNVLGRKSVLILLVPVMVAGWAFHAWASQVWMLFLGRFIVGAVTGGFCIVAPMYTGEIAETSVRGTLGSYFQLLLVCGVLFVYSLGYLMNSVFLINIICGALPIVAGVVFFFFFPDTAQWYLSKGKKESARASLVFYRGHDDVDAELRQLETKLEEERAQRTSCTKAFSTAAAKRGLMLSLLTMIFQQLSGINAVIFYASDLFRDAGSSLTDKQSTVVVGVCLVGATYLSTLLIDRAGRKPLLFISAFVCALCAAGLGLYMYLKEVQMMDLGSYGWVPIMTMAGFMIMFSIGLGPIPWLYMGEIFSPEIKGIAMSIANMSNWVTVFVVTKFYGDVKSAVGDYTTFWIFAGILLLACVFVWTILVETKGKSLDAILSELSGSKGVEPAMSDAGEEVIMKPIAP